MNVISPKKLLNSKWTAVHPESKERHFVVVDCICKPKGVLDQVDIRAVLTGETYRLPWQDLKDETVWQIGWQP